MFNLKSFLFVAFVSVGFANDLTITADEMKYNDKTKESYATGHAKAHFKKQGKEYVLTADAFKMKRDLKSNNQYESVQAKGSVIFKTEDYVLSANECHYQQLTEVVHCFGDVSILDLKKENTILGAECSFDLREQNYTMKGNCAKKTETILKLK